MFANFARKFLVLFVSSLLLLGFGGRVAEKNVEKGVTVGYVDDDGIEFDDDESFGYVSINFINNF